MLVCISILPSTEAVSAIDILKMGPYTPDPLLVTTLPNFTCGSSSSCCETRKHGYLIVQAKVIQSDCPRSSSMPYSSTIAPFSSSPFSSLGTSETSSPSVETTSNSVTSPSTNSTTSSATSPTTNSTTSSVTSPTTSSTTSSVTSSTTNSTTTSVTPSSNSSSTSTSTSTRKESSSRRTRNPKPTSSFPSSTFPSSSMFPSSMGSSTPPDYSCGFGEKCCETRVIGHVVVLAEVIGEQNGQQYTSTESPYLFTR